MNFIAVPLPVFVCNSHKVTKEQARKLLNDKLRTSVTRKAGPRATLRWERAWVAHVVIGAA